MQPTNIIYSVTVKSIKNYGVVPVLMAAALLLAGCGDNAAAPTATPVPAPPQATATPMPAAVTALPTVKVSLPSVSTGNGASGKPLVSPLNSPIQAAAAGDAAPKQRSVWNTTVSTDNMTGDCKASVLPVYGLVQITPEGDTLTWKNQEPKPYLMKKIAANQFQYVGPSVVNDGTVTMTATFVDDKSFSMTRDFVAKGVPGCRHHHDYVGVFQWNK